MENAQTSELAKKFELKPQIVKQYKKTFDTYDKQQEGTVLVKDLPAIFKILGTTINDSQINEILGDKVNRSDNPLISPTIDFPDFLTLIVQKDSEFLMKQELMQSFKVFDPQNKGFIPLVQFRYLMKTYGTPLSEEEVQDMIKDSQPQDGNIKYQKFVNLMLGIS